jgi:hypothetical protein
MSKAILKGLLVHTANILTILSSQGTVAQLPKSWPEHLQDMKNQLLLTSADGP